MADEYLAALTAVDPDAAAAAGAQPRSPFPGFAPEDFDVRRAAAERALSDLAVIEPGGHR